MFRCNRGLSIEPILFGCSQSTVSMEQAADGSQESTALHAAIINEDAMEILLLLDQVNDVNFRDSDGRTPLHVAAQYGHNDAIGMLLSRGADISIQDNGGLTPPHVAVRARQTEATAVLLSRGAVIDVTDNALRRMLEGLVINNPEAAARLLIERWTA